MLGRRKLFVVPVTVLAVAGVAVGSAVAASGGKAPKVDKLKIDRSFVTGLPDSANDAAITEAILAMAKTLGLCPIAEGIETEAQHEFLLRAGCVEGQGYLYSYPLPAAAIERMLRPKQQPAGSKLKLVPPKRG